MNCTHQRLYPCFRMSSEASSSITLSLLCWPARCSINDVAEPLGKFSARILRARTEPNLFVSVLRRALSFGDEFSAHSSSGPTVNLSILASVPLFTLNTPRTGTPLPSGAGPSGIFRKRFSINSGTLKLSLSTGISLLSICMYLVSTRTYW